MVSHSDGYKVEENSDKTGIMILGKDTMGEESDPGFISVGKNIKGKPEVYVDVRRYSMPVEIWREAVAQIEKKLKEAPR